VTEEEEEVVFDSVRRTIKIPVRQMKFKEKEKQTKIHKKWW
jgi:hypothetical protein